MDNLLTNLFDAMTREELRILAKVLEIKQGRNKFDTCISIAEAIEEGKAQLKCVVFVLTSPAKGIMRSKTLFMKDIRPGVIKPIFLPEDKEMGVAIDMTHL